GPGAGNGGTRPSRRAAPPLGARPVPPPAPEGGRALLVVLGLVVGPEDVLAEVARGGVPDGVHVIGAGLGVVVLDDECRPLDPIVVRLAALEAAGPGEGDLVPARLLGLLEVLRRQFAAEPVGVLFDQHPERLLLLGIELAPRNTRGFEHLDL